MNTENIPESSYNSFLTRILPYLGNIRQEDRLTFATDVTAAVRLLVSLGKDQEEVCMIMERIGLHLTANTGEGFTADYQIIPLGNAGELWVIQVPGGGNLNLITTPNGDLVLDTGYGCWYHDLEQMLTTLGHNGFSDVRRVICTHADADHCGASGYFPVTPYMHPVTKQILDSGTRGFGSDAKHPLLEKVYTTTINSFSKMSIPETIELGSTTPETMHGPFPVIDHISFGDLRFEVWESLGGHIAGQIFLYEPNLGLLFTSDALINFSTLSDARKDYCSIADYLVTSVNVNSAIARTERKELTKIATDLNAELKAAGKQLYIISGHGAVSCIDETGTMTPATPIHTYTAAGDTGK